MRSSPCLSSWLFSWLLVAPCLSVPGVPIYCRRFKGDCRRSKSTCCLFWDKTTQAPVTSTTTSFTDSLEEYIDKLDFTDGGDPLDAQPSYVEEVFVKPSLEHLILLTKPEDILPSTQGFPSQSSPGFCSTFLISCSTRPGHQCCRNKTEEKLDVSSSSRNKLLGPLVGQTTEEEQEIERSKQTNTTKDDNTRKEKERKTPKYNIQTSFKYAVGARNRRLFNRRAKTIKEPQSVSPTDRGQYTERKEENKATPQSIDFSEKDQTKEFSKPVKSKYENWSKSRSLFKKKTKSSKGPKISTSSTIASTIGAPAKKKPSKIFKNQKKSSLFGRRPRSFDPRKSALCRIVNCGRSPHHKCCTQEEEEHQEVTTTTEAAVTEMTQVSSTFGRVTLQEEYTDKEVVTTEMKLLFYDEVHETEGAIKASNSEMKDNSDTTIEEAEMLNEFDSSVEKESILLTAVHPSESIILKDEAGGESFLVEADGNGSISEGDEEKTFRKAKEEGIIDALEVEGSRGESKEESTNGEAEEEGSVEVLKLKESSEKEVNTADTGTATEPVNIINEAEKIDKADIIQVAIWPTDAKEEPYAENKIQAEEQINSEEEINYNKETVTATADILEIFLATSSTSPEPEFKQRWIAPVYVPAWQQRQEEKDLRGGNRKEDEERKEDDGMEEDKHNKEEHVEEKELKKSEEEASQREEMIHMEEKANEIRNNEPEEAIIKISETPSVIYYEIDNGIDRIGLGDSDTVEDYQMNSLDDEDDWSSDWTDCREFDCLVSPSPLCCSPHATEKRQTGAKGWQGGGPRVTVLSLPGFNSLVAPLVLDYPGRVTATVTRVEKSYSSSKWKKLDIIDNNL